MNGRHKPPTHRPQNRAYRQAFERLDAALEKNASSDYSEKIRRLGQVLFGELWDEPDASGESNIPEEQMNS